VKVWFFRTIQAVQTKHSDSHAFRQYQYCYQKPARDMQTTRQNPARVAQTMSRYQLPIEKSRVKLGSSSKVTTQCSCQRCIEAQYRILDKSALELKAQQTA
jgi:hypothetical protein